MGEEYNVTFDQFDQIIIGNRIWSDLKPSEVSMLLNDTTKQQFKAKIEEAKKNLVFPLEACANATGRFQYIYKDNDHELSIREELIQLGKFLRMNGYTNDTMKNVLYQTAPSEFSYRDDFQEIINNSTTK